VTTASGRPLISSVAPGCPFGRPGFRPVVRRCDLGAGLARPPAKGPPRRPHPGHRHARLLRPPPLALGATDEREHCELLRQYFPKGTQVGLPKGTDITSHQPYLDAIADELNDRPRAVLGYLTPREVFTQLLLDNEPELVAMTG
jgi:hypothetical protein